MCDIISVLKQRSSLNPESIDAKLCVLANKIIELSTEHQKRVIKIMPEFDLHDATHLKKVEENIALLLGEERLAELSSVELFLLLAAAYLHDCGMAPADWELSLMKLTEGYDAHGSSKESICNDGKKPYSFRDAKELIEKNKQHLYKSFDEIRTWEFAPDSEIALINSLSEMFIEYQGFRNGYIDQIKDATKNGNFDTLNDSIKVDFIRTSHHKKSAEYVKNLQKIATDILGGAWIQRLFSDLADVCKSHGEDIDFVRNLKKDVKYVGSDVANLQFISMMLRLGDIVHYSSDRAPSILRNAMSFQSEYSKKEWLNKVGLNYTIKDGIITFMASCQTPKDYYHLQSYLNWIDVEINNLDLLKRGWQQKYQINIGEVDRKNVEPDRSKFIPVRDKKFTLSQNKIIELLMGVNLYKDPFSPIRELYQNSLDACRCRLAIAEMNGLSMKGEIEFGIEKGSDGQYLYCKDNGIGMDEYIIENFLLKIGNSFYSSKEFYRKQSQWGSTYTPVSQFGIGILSCFIIGYRIEIVTKSVGTNQCIVCCIDGTTENFYYKVPSREDEELISDSGTFVKVFLRTEYEKEINNSPIQKLGLLLLCDSNEIMGMDFGKYNPIYEIWKTNLYHYLNDYINRVPDGITLNVRFSDNSIQKIFDKPYTLNIGDWSIEQDDQYLIDQVFQINTFNDSIGSIVELQKHLKLYPIHIETESIEYNSIIALPLASMESMKNEYLPFKILKVMGSTLSVDGISVDDDLFERSNYFRCIKFDGSINYIGSIKPQLSVDRKNIVSFPVDFTDKYRNVVDEYIKAFLKIANDHIRQNDLLDNAEAMNLIWGYIFKRMEYSQSIFVNNLVKSELGNIVWPASKNLMGREITIKELLSLDEITLYQYNYHQLDYLSKMLVSAVFLTAKNIEAVNDMTIKIIKDSENLIPEIEHLEYSQYILTPAEDNDTFKEYDLISNLFPLVPNRLIAKLSDFTDIMNSKSISVSIRAWGSGYTALFLQDSRLVDPKYGLYNNAKPDFAKKRDSYVHAFEYKKNKFHGTEFNNDSSHGNSCTPYLAYISPALLTPRDIELLESLKDSEPIYYEGVKNGWTLLVTTMDIDNVIIRPGKVDRQTMINQISPEFWNKYNDWTFKFLDGTEMKKPE
ncbi:MAG: ATP-binding protein [Muribaculaceae bacterium]|nr:ATP-binding protein [Muribaculaceae bacterium]